MIKKNYVKHALCLILISISNVSSGLSSNINSEINDVEYKTNHPLASNPIISNDSDEKLEGVLDVLLYGGTLVGKVAQALSSTFSYNYDEVENSEDRIQSNITVPGNITFTRNNQNIFESNNESYDSTAMITISNEPSVNANSVTYYVEPRSSAPFDEIKSSSPYSKIITSLVPSNPDPKKSEFTNGTKSSFKLVLKGLKINAREGINVGSFGVRATNSSLLIAAGTSLSAYAMYLTSQHYSTNNGREVTNNNRYSEERDRIDVMDNKERVFNVDLQKLGLSKNDDIEATIMIETDKIVNQEELRELSPIKSTPFTPYKTAFFNHLAMLRQLEYQK